MRIPRWPSKTGRMILFLCCVFLCSPASFSKLLTPRDFSYGVLDAELVVIVHQESHSKFIVEEVFLGNASGGDSIKLPGFRLFTEQRYGPDTVEPITSGTRILLFLHHKKDAPAAWEPTYFGNCFFWVQDSQQVSQLRNMVEQPVGLRRGWGETAPPPKPSPTAGGLGPFLSLK